jgi:signal transduction histidine kinase
MLAGATNGPMTERMDRDRAVQEERRRLARELHDGIAQELAFILAQSRRLAKIFPEERALADIGSAAEHALHGSRAAIYGLQETTSPTLGAAIEARSQQLAGRAGLELKLNIEDEIESSAKAEHGVLSILHEAISNAVRHGEATRMEISLAAREDTILLRISDDGRGFVPEWRAPTSTGGLGLWSMLHRAEALDGELRLESAPGRGTTIELAIAGRGTEQPSASLTPRAGVAC